MAEDQTAESPLPPGARRDSRIFMVLLLVTVVLNMLSIPLAFGAVLTGPAAALVGIRALWRSMSTPKVAPFRYAMVAGVLVSAFATFMGLVLIVFREPVENRQECMARAITTSAEDACEREYMAEAEQLVDDLLARVGLTRP
ncbi:hypothetical protein [Demequina aestuarii]|uniref:hypothetical protein n=1 Tax=Demequina aestuarii TaxID=327095 RepID=UPI000783B0CF|nr:hypothetical protein [Demequina aestuarii]